MRLASKIVLLCLLAMTAMSGLFSYFTIRRDAQFFADEHGRIASQLADVLKHHLSKTWNGGDHEKRAEAVEDCSIVYHHVRVRYVLIGGASAVMEPSAPSHMLKTVADGHPVTVTSPDKVGNRSVHTYISFAKTVSDGGFLEFSRSMEDIDARARETLWSTLLSLIGASLLSAGVIFFGGVHMIGRPLSLLVEKTKRIGKGDLTGPVQVGGNTELSQFGTALNEMCVQLSAQQEAIKAEVASRDSAEKQLRHADRLNTVGRLAAGIAHEMGTPLNVVSGRASLIANGKLSDEDVRQSATTIKTEADRITKIIRQLLDFARRSTPQRSPADVRTVVEKTVDLLRSFAEKQAVQLDIAYDGDSFDANVDVGQFQQVCTNLIMNALQSIDERGRVEIRLRNVQASPPDAVDAPTGKYVRVDVKDSGCGVSVDDREHIFEPFYTSKDVGEGTGLGLSISYGIIRDHDGWIEVTSKPEVGSCFSVFLPHGA